MVMFPKLQPVLAVFIFFVFKVWSQHNNMCSIVLEAENGHGGEREYRSNASGGLSVRLLEGETISYQMDFAFTDNTCTLQLLSVTYSNDGPSDRVQVSLDTTSLGSFQTFASSNGGKNWNIFRTQNGFTSKVKLSYSRFMITVDALETDDYGVEIDKISLQLECTNKVSTEDAQCSPSIFSQDNSTSGNNEINSHLSDGLLVTIVFGVVGSLSILIGIPGCIIASQKLLRKKSGSSRL